MNTDVLLSQGAVLTSSDRGGIRIQYSRNPFGKKRDYDGSFINTPTSATYSAVGPYESGGAAAAPYTGAGTTAAYGGSGDYSAPATAPGTESAQAANGQAAAYDAGAQPGEDLHRLFISVHIYTDFLQKCSCDAVC